MTPYYQPSHSPQDILTNVCQAMVFLNRNYCKSPSVSRTAKDHVSMTLKVPLVHWLCDNDYCVGLTDQDAPRRCKFCAGTGKDVIWGRNCIRCNGSGVFTPRTVGFVFVVRSIKYGWHLPKPLICFQLPQVKRCSPFVEDDTPTPTIEWTPSEAKRVVHKFLVQSKQVYCCRPTT